MEEQSAGYPCAIIVDDLLEWGEGTADHDVNLKKVIGREATIKTDLKPLTTIANKPLHSAPTRLHCMLLKL